MRNIKFQEAMLRYKSDSGSSIDYVIKDLLDTANISKMTCVVAFNETDLIAHPEGNAAIIYRIWHCKFEYKAKRMSYTEYTRLMNDLEAA